MFSQKRFTMCSVACCCFLLALVWVPGFAEADPEVLGVYGLESTGDEAWLAFSVPIPEGSAIAGFLWYNNDGAVVFPSLRVGTGYEGSPGLIEDFVGVSGAFSGESSAWSELVFSEPVAASLGSLYLAMEFPVQQAISGTGEGKGPGVGYQAGSGGCRGWLSGDGEVWARLHDDYSFAIQPVFVPFEEGMAVKSFGDEVEAVPAAVTGNYFRTSPNPFNPKTTIAFGLVAAGDVAIDVYDLKGSHVKKLHQGFLEAGHHEVNWLGRDGAERRVSSGVYFVKLRGKGFGFQKKVLLIK